MGYLKIKTLAHSIILFSILFSFPTFGQPKVVDAVHLTQISSFETDYSIIDMKMSADDGIIGFETADLC